MRGTRSSRRLKLHFGNSVVDRVHEAFGVYADAVARHDPRTRLLYFDVTTLGASATPETASRWATLVREVGPERILFGSDATAPDTSAGRAWTALRQLLPLTAAEYRVIAANVLPHLKQPGTM